jgi:hypothetical protein
MPAVQIRETIVTPHDGGETVQLYISDAAREDEGAAIRLALTVSIPEFRMPLMVHVQRAAIEKALAALRGVNEALGKELMQSSHPPTPTLK